MYNLIALSLGGLISLMLMINGELTSNYGLFTATVIIHLVGSLFAFFALKVRKQRVFSNITPLWLYLGGAIGALTVYFNNFAVGKISLTSIVALGLFGQTVASLIIDLFGLFGMKKYPLQKPALIGIIFSCFGIWVMLGDLSTSAVISVIFSFGAGITIVLSRTVNARLAKYSGALGGSFINHLVGLATTFAVLLLFGRRELFNSGFVFKSSWIYLGGILGVGVVLGFNLLVPELPALKITLLTFIGQVFTGVALDLLLRQGFDRITFLGGLIIAFGILINLGLEDRQRQKKNAAKLSKR